MRSVTSAQYWRSVEWLAQNWGFAVCEHSCCSFVGYGTVDSGRCVQSSYQTSRYTPRTPPGYSNGPSITSVNILLFISIHVPFIFFYFVLRPTNAQLFHKLSHCYMFRHCRVILRELVINILPSYTSISNATHIKPMWNILIVNCITDSCVWHTIVSKHVTVW